MRIVVIRCPKEDVAVAKHHIEHHGAEHVEHHHHKKGGEMHEKRAHGGMAGEGEREIKNQEIDGGHPDHARGGAAHEKHETHGGHRMAEGGHAMHNRGPHPGKGHPHHAKGGHAKGEDHEDGESGAERDAKAQVYNAPGSRAMESATDEEPGFAKGGKTHKKRRSGGHASGEMEHARLDRRPRRAHGGRAEGGGSPYSSASKMMTPSAELSGRGFEGVSKDLRGTK